ncbi:MAG: Bax inhibitor-1/YccA family protein [Bacteroidota bacterium]|nr:Bax inhibitor-1/YccA family protein [Bacteroidota bacterium]
MDRYPGSAYSFTPEAVSLAGEARLAYIRKVYTFFGLGIAGGVVGSLIAMNTSLVFFAIQHPFIGLIAFLGMAIFASASAGNPSRAVPTLIGFTFVSGVIISPTLYAIAHGFIRGTGVAVIYDALFLTSLVFGALTAYVFITKKDFSYMGASLMIGLFMVIGVSLVNLFVQSTTMDLALSAIIVILFSGFILYDTSRILKNAHEIPPTLAALNLYLDFLNLFMAILRLLSRNRD